MCLYVCINGVVCILRFDFSHCVNRTYSNFVCASTPHIVTLYPLHTPDFDIICAHFAAVCGPVQIFTQLHYYKRISSYMHFTYIHMYVCALVLESLALLRLIIHFCCGLPFFLSFVYYYYNFLLVNE